MSAWTIGARISRLIKAHLCVTAPKNQRLTGRSSGRRHWPWLRHFPGQCRYPPPYRAPAPLTFGVRPSCLKPCVSPSFDGSACARLVFIARLHAHHQQVGCLSLKAVSKPSEHAQQPLAIALAGCPSSRRPAHQRRTSTRPEHLANSAHITKGAPMNVSGTSARSTLIAGSSPSPALTSLTGRCRGRLHGCALRPRQAGAPELGR